MEKDLISHFIHQMKETLEGDNWVDENFKKKLDGLNEEDVFKRPIPEMHSVAELVSHIIVWKQEVLSRLRGNDPKLSMESSENWKDNDELREKRWKALKSQLFKSQDELIKFLTDKNDDFLTGNGYAKGYTYKYLVDGIVQHDMYHLGQLGITIKLLKERDIMAS